MCGMERRERQTSVWRWRLRPKQRILGRKTCCCCCPVYRTPARSRTKVWTSECVEILLSPDRMTVLHCNVWPWHAGILKKKQLSPIAERNAINRIHNQLSGDSASSRGPSSGEGRGGGARRDHLNGASVSGLTKTLDNDSSESEWDDINNLTLEICCVTYRFTCIVYMRDFIELYVKS